VESLGCGWEVKGQYRIKTRFETRIPLGAKKNNTIARRDIMLRAGV
jgi:hypothetical protein